jgi:hypothetical protein
MTPPIEAAIGVPDLSAEFEAQPASMIAEADATATPARRSRLECLTVSNIIPPLGNDIQTGSAECSSKTAVIGN